VEPVMTPVIEITPRAATQIASGSLWIFSNEILSTAKPAVSPGSLCSFRCREELVATGYYNPHSLIAGRVFARGRVDDIHLLLHRRLEEAFRRRHASVAGGSVRLVYSEADFLPGLILDLYSDDNDNAALVLQSNTAGIDGLLNVLETIIPEAFQTVFKKKPTGFVVRGDTGVRKLEGIDEFSKIVFGDEEKLRQAVVVDQGVRFAANLVDGQKTGFFLDQRDNRAFLSRLIASSGKKKVLDLFSYSGGWGLTALKAGAASVVFVDESKEALALTGRGLELNGFPPETAKLTLSNVFDFLEKEAETFDVVVADPPAFVKSKKDLPKAIRAYEKLNRLAWRRLKTNGVLISCSCSYHLSESDFMELLQSAVSKEKGMAHVVYRGLQAADHPILLSMPETHYLKCVALQKISV
jgi:23S rRNA (cytosine1962-C5)-methyltransferase